MRPIEHLDVVLSSMRSFGWMFEEERIDYEFDEEDDTLFVTGTIFFHDESRLVFKESVTETAIRYGFQYLDSTGALIFRYDNTPHHPHLENFPYHKHVGSSVEPAATVTLHQVLTEIEKYLLNTPND